MTTKTVLVVDDEFTIRRLLSRILRQQGVQVITADSVATAEMLLLYNEVDLVICDQQMPGETGLSFLRRLREQFPEIVRALITGHVSFAVTVEAINDAQVHYCITKPFDVQEIKDLVADLLTWNDGREAAPRRAFTQAARQELRDLTECPPGIAEVRRVAGGAIGLGDSDADADLFADADTGPSADAGSGAARGPGGRQVPDNGVILFDDDFIRMIGA
jgi:DNA-binding NtrC family response regulator